MTTNWEEEFLLQHAQASALARQLRDMEIDRDAQKAGRELAEAEAVRLQNMIMDDGFEHAGELYQDHIDTQESVRPR